MEEDGKRLKLARGKHDAAIQCKHGIRATECEGCKQPDLLESRTKTGIVREAVLSLLADRTINQVEVYEPEKGKHRRISYRRLAVFAGVSLVGAMVVYESIKRGKGIVLHLVKRTISSKPS